MEARRCSRVTGHTEDTEQLKERERERERNSQLREEKHCQALGDCHSAIDLTKLQIPSQDPLSPLHLAKAGILIPAIIKLLTNSTYVSVSSSA